MIRDELPRRKVHEEIRSLAFNIMKKSDLSIEFAGLQIIIVQSLVCFLCIFSMCLAGCNQKVIEPEPPIGLIECSEAEPIKCWQSGYGVYIFQSDRGYNLSVKSDSPHPDCGDYKKPDFDFDEETIIYVDKSYTGCEPALVEQSLEYKGNDQYELRLEVKVQGGCYALWGHSSICSTAKIPDNATLTIIENVEIDWDYDQ